MTETRASLEIHIEYGVVLSCLLTDGWKSLIVSKVDSTSYEMQLQLFLVVAGRKNA